jgi:hypothetical protein
VHSSTIQKIDIIRQFKVRRKSIKFIRDLTGKAARLKEVKKDIQVVKEAPKKEEKPVAKVEAPVEEKKVEAPKKEEVKTEVKAEKAPVEKKEEAPKTEEK